MSGVFKDLKVFDNLFRRNRHGSRRQLTRLEMARLSADLQKKAYEVLNDEVQAILITVSEDELSAMLEVIQDRSITSRLMVVQTSTPTQFLVARRNVNVFS